MNRPRLSCRSATAHKHVKAAVVVKVAGVGLVYRILPGSPALSRRNADYRGLEAGACRGCIEAR